MKVQGIEPGVTCTTGSALFPGYLSLGLDRDRAEQIEHWGTFDVIFFPRLLDPVIKSKV